ncbi:MAG: hypothetical protein LUE10_03320, partial [Alistipes sp.]|nr:hypothetical protein [Alistipes sp.]
MKTILYPMFIAIASITTLSCSVNEGMEDCPDIPGPGADTICVYLAFECIEIYDTDREIVFDKVTEELELLFYDPDGILAYDLRSTAADMVEAEGEVE